MTTETEVVCGIDLGSTNTKIVALDAGGRVVARMRAPTPRGSDGLLRATELLDTIEGLLVRIGGAGLVILACCGAGVGEDGLLLAPDLQPVCDILPWYHPHRGAVFDELRAGLGEVAGLPVGTDAARTLVGWRWARQQPDAARAAAWVSLTDWPGTRWSGRPFMSDTIAARTAAWLPWGGGWLPDRVAMTLGQPHLLPEVVPAGTVIGPLRSRVLTAAGVVSADAVVVAGGHDHPVGAWAVQQLSPAALVDSMGTAEVVVTQTPRGAVARSARVDVAPAVSGDGTTVLSVQQLARDVSWASEEALVAMAIRRLLVGSALPTDDAWGDAFVPGGWGGSAPRFASGAPADPLARASAVLGRLAREGEERLRWVSRTLDLPPGVTPEVVATGGWSRSTGWMAIKEAVSERTFRRIAEPEVTACAAALLAAHAVGWDVPADRALGGSLPGPAAE